MKLIIAAIATVSAAAYLATRNTASVDGLIDDQPDQTTSTLEDIAVTLTPSTYEPAAVTLSTAQQNEAAFLDMIAYSEGTTGGGYYTQFGYPRNPARLCDNLDDHPRLRFPFTDKTGKQLFTTAAGRYQFLARTWDSLAAKLGLTDFGPASQDAAALELVRQRGATNDVRAGRITAACTKCAPIWASLPGAGYNQPERKLSSLIAAYSAAGGNLEA